RCAYATSVTSSTSSPSRSTSAGFGPWSESPAHLGARPGAKTRDLHDFIRRAGLQHRDLEALTQADALVHLAGQRHQAYWEYASYESGPNRAVEHFLAERGGAYEIDAALCDLFGHNVTYNPNGWLKRVR
ncbi:MAG: hypothetical protein ACREX4_25275, partial [Gammaproteobacteria bacterium]